MPTATEIPRGHVWVCGSILGVTAAGKLFALLQGGGLLTQPHPFLPGTFQPYLWLGLAAELLAFVVLLAAGSRAFLTVCLGMSVVFIGYHALEAGLDIAVPCPCLGGLLGHWKPLAQAESTVSFLLACGLALGSFTGLFPVSRVVPPALPAQPARRAAVLAMGLWLVAGAAIVGLWHGRILGGDEGMEAAKSLQLLARPESLQRMWNDQPPLWSWIGAGLFGVCGPSLTAGRIAVLLIGLTLPLTWAIYWSREGIRWAAVVSTVLLWLSVPSVAGAYMLEAPAYAVGTAALLPLVLRGSRPIPLLISALLAALALSLKLTAAFALVVPFAWLFQRKARHALGWGLSVVALTWVGSLFQPGWSWGLMAASHLSFSAEQMGRYHLNPAAYARGWFVCALALFALAHRYLQNRLVSLIPWLAAALVALGVHWLHRPFWDYYNLHLLAPVIAMAGVGAADLWTLLQRAQLPVLERRSIAVAVLSLGLLWTGVEARQMSSARESATLLAGSPITEQLKSLGESGHAVFSLNPTWTFAAHQVQTPPELTIIPLKRAWAGQINDTVIAGMLASNRVDGIVLNQSVLKQSAWSNLLTAYWPTAREDQNILFVRRELNPKPIDLGKDNETTLDLRRLGLQPGVDRPTNLFGGKPVLTHRR